MTLVEISRFVVLGELEAIRRGVEPVHPHHTCRPSWSSAIRSPLNTRMTRRASERAADPHSAAPFGRFASKYGDSLAAPPAVRRFEDFNIGVFAGAVGFVGLAGLVAQRDQVFGLFRLQQPDMPDAVRQAGDIATAGESLQGGFQIFAGCLLGLDMRLDQVPQPPVANPLDFLFVQRSEILAVDEIGALLLRVLDGP